MASVSSQMNVLDLFAGCGGLSSGFHKQGFNVVCANELESEIAHTYETNFPDTTVVVGDIVKPDVKNKIYDAFAGKTCDIVVGGPPCVAYSMSGLRDPRDPRGQLFKDYVSIVDTLKPKCFVMENVSGMLSMMHDKPDMDETEKAMADEYHALEKEKLDLQTAKKSIMCKITALKKETQTYEVVENLNKLLGDLDTAKKTLTKVTSLLKKKSKTASVFRMPLTDIMKMTFNDIGYNVDFKLLNAADYGVPQRRKRVIFIGVRKDIDVDITFPEPTHNKDGNDGKMKWVSVRDAIDDLNSVDETVDMQHIFTKHSPTFIEKIKNTPIGKSVNPRFTEAFFKCDPELPSGTVKENHGGVFVHYEQNRVMTPRELARLQSFPDDFIFTGSKSNMLVQLGNAVPCGLSHAIASHIKNNIIG